MLLTVDEICNCSSEWHACSILRDGYFEPWLVAVYVVREIDTAHSGCVL